MTRVSRSTAQPEASPPSRPYVPVVGPRLRKILFVVLGLFSLLAVNASYLVGVSLLEWLTGKIVPADPELRRLVQVARRSPAD